jgi:LysR family transcriptional regulator, hydrogen peroxide-inducible genes activator
MTLTELRYIVAVAKQKHFGRAAEACFVSQPTLSVAVRKLEDELGIQLFERGNNEITVTALGLPIITQAQYVLEQAQEIRELALHHKNPLQGHLRLGVIYTIGPYLLPFLIPAMIEKQSQMPLLLEESFTVRLLEQLRQGEIDCAILAEPFNDSGLITEFLYQEPFVVAIPKNHHWNNRETIHSNELQQETMLLLGHGHCFRDHVLEVCPELSRFSQNAHGLQKTFEGSSLEILFYPEQQ